ncbi:hypothetical protein [Actinacidiphila yeochonensis]|uniref:hypothetical protein n=1 Tax=Actinacidiphila yeochonensis TaxID=89050 RepID=UPI000565D522|nr:hypothetical protein [Actinacidiphila yeochonensis]
MKTLLTAVRSMTSAQRWIALAVLIGLLLLVPALPHAVLVPVAAVAVWAAAQPLLVGMLLGAYAYRRAGGAR